MTNTAIILGYMQLNNLDTNKIVLHTYAQWKKLGYQVKKEKNQSIKFQCGSVQPRKLKMKMEKRKKLTMVDTF